MRGGHGPCPQRPSQAPRHSRSESRTTFRSLHGKLGFTVHSVGVRSWDLFKVCWLDAGPRVYAVECRVQGQSYVHIDPNVNRGLTPWCRLQAVEGREQGVISEFHNSLKPNQRCFPVKNLPGPVTVPTKNLPGSIISRGLAFIRLRFRARREQLKC